MSTRLLPFLVLSFFHFLKLSSFISGSPLKDENSWTDFMSTRTFSTLNVVRDVKCDVCFPFPFFFFF